LSPKNRQIVEFLTQKCVPICPDWLCYSPRQRRLTAAEAMMRLAILPLSLYAGTMAFGQTAPAPALNLDQTGRTPPAMMQPGSGFTRMLPVWPQNLFVPPARIVRPGVGETRRWQDAQIDPGMIIHPPPASIGAQPPGALVARNLYPRLQFLPIEWPNLKIEKIPVQWPDAKLGPARGRPPALVQHPANY
jgi:hypothetical protein